MFEQKSTSNWLLSSKNCHWGHTNLDKLEKISEASLDLIPSPSVKIQIIGGKVYLRWQGKTLLGDFNKLFVFKSLLTMPSNVLPLHLKQVKGMGSNLCYLFKNFVLCKKIVNSASKVEKILKGSLDLIPSPSVKIQTMGRKVF